jgi:hypothetical protein
VVSGFSSVNGTFTYTPNPGFSGPDSIKFTADDTIDPSNVGTVRLAVSSSSCICECWGDPDCDGEQSIYEMIFIIRIIFEGLPPSISDQCPTWDADYNCNCFLDLFDMVLIIDYIFRGGPPLSCDPCEANCFPID